MSNTVKWVAGIGGSAVAGVSIIYLGVAMLLRSYPADSAELEDAELEDAELEDDDDAVAGCGLLGRTVPARPRPGVVSRAQLV